MTDLKQLFNYKLCGKKYYFILQNVNQFADVEHLFTAVRKEVHE
jgi:hypothetical protein